MNPSRAEENMICKNCGLEGISPEADACPRCKHPLADKSESAIYSDVKVGEQKGGSVTGTHIDEITNSEDISGARNFDDPDRTQGELEE
jgi:hypothetical protein